MREWAVELQHFLVSGATDTQAQQRAASACKDSGLREYIARFPSSLEQTDDSAFSALIEKVAPEGITAEAVILRLVHHLPLLERAEGVLHLQALTEACYIDSVLDPSLAFLCHLTGRFHSRTRAFDRAREAYKEGATSGAASPPTVNGPPTPSSALSNAPPGGIH